MAEKTALDYALNDTWLARLIRGATNAAVQGASLPGDVYSGRSDPMSIESIGRAADLAGLVTLGAGAIPAEANALRAGLSRPKALYREASPEEALEFIPGSASQAGRTWGGREYHFADDPSLALGQGSNRGVTMNLDPQGFDLTKNTAKPGLGIIEDAPTEYKGMLAKNADEKAALRSFTVDPSAVERRDPFYRALTSQIDRLEKEGWSRSVDESGRTVMKRPGFTSIVIGGGGAAGAYGMSGDPAEAGQGGRGMDFTIEQQRALALASARQRMAGGQSAPAPQSEEPQTVAGYIMNDSWPAKMIKGVAETAGSIATLPGDVAAGRVDPLSDEAIGRSAETAMALSPVNPMVRAGDAVVPGVRTALEPATKTRVPTSQELRTAADAGYDAVRDMGVSYHPEAVATAARTIKQTLERDGILGRLAPDTHAILDELANPPAGAFVTSEGLEGARRALNTVGQKNKVSNPTEGEAARQAVGAIDELVVGAAPESVISGPAAAAGKTLADARGNYAASKRSERLAGEDNYGSVEGRATLNAQSANSGANIDNAIRQQAKSILTNPKERARFTKEEQAELWKITAGKGGQNALRRVGNILGGGGGMGAAVSGGIAGAAGGALGGPAGMAIGVIPPLVGMGAKAGENAMSKRALRLLDEKTRMRSPLYSKFLDDAKKSKNPERYAALLRAMGLDYSADQDQ